MWPSQSRGRCLPHVPMRATVLNQSYAPAGLQLPGCNAVAGSGVLPAPGRVWVAVVALPGSRMSCLHCRCNEPKPAWILPAAWRTPCPQPKMVHK